MTLTYTVTAYRISNRIVSALVDGAVATLKRAAHLLTWAKAEGKVELLEAVDAVEPGIGNALAHRLHIDLGKLHIGGGHALASEVLGRRVTSLAALTLDEARELWSFACALAELPTLPSAVYGRVAA